MMQGEDLPHLALAKIWVGKLEEIVHQGDDLPEDLIAEALMEIHFSVIEDPARAKELFVVLAGLTGIPSDTAKDIFTAP
jgi:hypothetical protein